MVDMRRYMDIAGAEASPADDYGMDYDEFGPAMPSSRPAMTPSEPVPALPAPTTSMAVVTHDDETCGDTQSQCKKVLAKIAKNVRDLAPVMLKGSVSCEPWMLEKLAAASEALEAVSEYVIDADAILVTISEGKKKPRLR